MQPKDARIALRWRLKAVRASKSAKPHWNCARVEFLDRVDQQLTFLQLSSKWYGSWGEARGHLNTLVLTLKEQRND